MARQPKEWIVYPQAPDSHFARLSHVAPLLVQLLWNRGITEPAAVEAFLSGETRPDDPFRIKGMNEAVTRIRRAIRQGERMVVYGDFDADGVTSTALLVQTLSALGGFVRPYIPHRVDEGYGLNINALAELAREGQQLIITVDCGIRSVEEVAFANRQGLDVIVTDHHSIGPQLPPALAVINPKRPDCPYPFKGLAGVGLAYKLAQALLRTHDKTPIRNGFVADLQEGDLLDLVALGTVADLAPLLDENRTLVQRGLARLNRTQRPGLQAMMGAAGVAPGQVTSTTIGFALGPRLNAAGRLDSAMLSYELLATDDVFKSSQLAGQLNALNARRQQVTAEAFEQAQAQIEADEAESFLHVAASEHFLAGIVGLVAGRLVEQYHRPTIVMELGPQQSRGSARSIAQFDITAALDRCAQEGLLVRHGGHAAAAGLTVENGKLKTLTSRLREIAAEELADKDLRPSLVIDAEVPLGPMDFAKLGQLQEMEPTGYANPQPRLLSRRVLVRDTRKVGADGAHLKMTVSDPAAGSRANVTFDAIAFRQGHWHGRLPAHVDLVYTMEENIWNGTRRLQLVVEDVRAAS
ncbi:MAG TPA: single-stranded-DNA-specific exonuclease RecJ [Anaerolineae bacterium]|nr:single-stranded-DNA-specific exonuclease RecJ [Anaerolineae bacterium]HNU05472.1 single-stranded-DNA-specific exonuclease RecJ [Anaerolineae bacterium]